MASNSNNSKPFVYSCMHFLIRGAGRGTGIIVSSITSVVSATIRIRGNGRKKADMPPGPDRQEADPKELVAVKTPKARPAKKKKARKAKAKRKGKAKEKEIVKEKEKESVASPETVSAQSEEKQK